MYAEMETAWGALSLYKFDLRREVETQAASIPAVLGHVGCFLLYINVCFFSIFQYILILNCKISDFCVSFTIFEEHGALKASSPPKTAPDH